MSAAEDERSGGAPRARSSPRDVPQGPSTHAPPTHPAGASSLSPPSASPRAHAASTTSHAAAAHVNTHAHAHAHMRSASPTSVYSHASQVGELSVSEERRRARACCPPPSSHAIAALARDGHTLVATAWQQSESESESGGVWPLTLAAPPSQQQHALQAHGTPAQPTGDAHERVAVSVSVVDRAAYAGEVRGVPISPLAQLASAMLIGDGDDEEDEEEDEVSGGERGAVRAPRAQPAAGAGARVATRPRVPAGAVTTSPPAGAHAGGVPPSHVRRRLSPSGAGAGAGAAPGAGAHLQPTSASGNDADSEPSPSGSSSSSASALGSTVTLERPPMRIVLVTPPAPQTPGALLAPAGASAAGAGVAVHYCNEFGQPVRTPAQPPSPPPHPPPS